jgi:hypothetical protein
VDVSIPVSVVVKATGIIRPRYLVIQTEVRGILNTETLVYAEVFYTRKAAKKAEKDADDRLRIKIGNRTMGSRRWSQLVKLPVDSR